MSADLRDAEIARLAERVRVLEGERAELTETLTATLEERPLADGTYAHLVYCNGDRRQPAGTRGVTCNCKVGTARAKQIAAERDRAQEEAATLRVALAAAEERAAYFCSDRNREGMRAEGIERERDALRARLEELTGEKVRERIRDCLNERTAISVGSPEWGPDKAADVIMDLLRKEGSR